MIVGLLLLAVGGVSVTPAAPTVGDPITIQLPLEPAARIEVNRSTEYEVLASGGSKVVVRRFRPGEFTVTGSVVNDGIATALEVPIRVVSVLGSRDAMKPAPLKPPRELPRNAMPWKWVGGASVLALLAWAAVFASRRLTVAGEASPAVAVNARAEFEAAVRGIRRAPHAHQNFVILGEATRRYFARIDPALGRHLTTSEIVRRLRRREVPGDLVTLSEEILRQADLAKFSPWGARSTNSIALADRALALTALEPEEKAA